MVAGALAVKAGMWTLVEHLYAAGHTKLYTGSVGTVNDVRNTWIEEEFLRVEEEGHCSPSGIGDWWTPSSAKTGPWYSKVCRNALA